MELLEEHTEEIFMALNLVSIFGYDTKSTGNKREK